jgi:hypothetical protein
MQAMSKRLPVIRLGACVAAVIACFVLATPRSGGPDEPSHMVASAALVRGERVGAPHPTDPSLRVFRVPAMVGEPDPGCWALQPEVAVGCASLTNDSTVLVTSPTTSANYPPWTYVLPGLASFVPTPTAYAYLARLLMAAIPLCLVVGALLRVRSSNRGAGVAMLLGLTPIAWFSMSIVNPSAVAIAGGLALWTALLVPVGPQQRFDVLLLAGWTATLVARRDGPLWVLLIVSTACLTLSIRPSSFLRRRPTPLNWLFFAVAVVPVATTFVTGLTGVNLLIAFAPIGLLVLDRAMSIYGAAVNRAARRRQLGGWALIGTLGVLAALRVSPGGFNPSVWLLMVSDTGDHLRQLVGVLGWLDAPVPDLALFLFWIGLGALAALAFLDDSVIALGATAAVAAMVVTAWILEVGQGATDGQYWQGRYSMPFFVGIPLLLASRRDISRRSSEGLGNVTGADALGRLALPIGVIAWLVMNIGFVGALHRWGVGVGGTWAPQRWNTWGAPLHPIVLILAHVAASTGLLLIVLRPASEQSATE